MSSYVNLETGARVERVVLPSRVRRGRMAASPVWYLSLPNGARWRFLARKDALAAMRAGGCPHTTDPSYRRHGDLANCWDCRASKVTL